jgi:cysteine synthase A
MRSTGEVMGIGPSFDVAFAKAQLAAAGGLPTSGRVYVAADAEQTPALLPSLRALQEMGFELMTDALTAGSLRDAGIAACVLDQRDAASTVPGMVAAGAVSLAVSIATIGSDRTINRVLRTAAARHGVPYVTTAAGLGALVGAVRARRQQQFSIRSLQEMHTDIRATDAPSVAAVGPSALPYPALTEPAAATTPRSEIPLITDNVYDLVPDDLFLRVAGVSDLDRLYLKVEGLNPAGSIKLKTASGIIAAAERSGIDMRRTRLVESTSGNLGVALAVICAAKGYRLTCVTDPNSNPTALSLMRALGADVVTVSDRDANGGYLGTRVAYIRDWLAADPRVHWLNQYANPSNPAAHELSTAPAVLRAFRRVDYLFLGVGTGGTLMGCVDHFRRHSPATRIVAVDTVGSVNFGSAAARHIPGLGASRRPEILDISAPDDVVLVPEWETVRECRWLARTTGLLAGGSTGTVMAAVRRMAPSMAVDATVVAIAPDMGERYLNSVYDDDWVVSKGLERAPEASATSAGGAR